MNTNKILHNIMSALSEALLEELDYDEYLHGSCHRWVFDNYKPGDKIFVITDYDEDIETYALVHCGIYRNGKYCDVKGKFDSIGDVLEEFDYGGEIDEQIMSLSEFKEYCRDNRLI